MDAGGRGLGVRHEDRVGAEQNASRRLAASLDRDAADRRCGRRGRSRPGRHRRSRRRTTSFSSASSAISAAVRMTMSAGVPPRSLSAMTPTAPNSPSMSRPVCCLEWRREAARPGPAPRRRSECSSCSCREFHRCDQALARDRQVAHAHAERIEHRVGDRRCDRAVRGFAGADGLAPAARSARPRPRALRRSAGSGIRSS